MQKPTHLEPAELDPQLVEALNGLLLKGRRTGQDLEAGLRRLERRHGNAVYTELLFLLSQVRFPPEEARRHWSLIVSHRDAMQAQMGQQVDLLVALVSYFVEVQQEMKTPVLVELKLLRETRASAYRDELTGLCNYRYFREYLEREILRGERYRPLLSLLMVDIDEFKKYNDRYGHEAGNAALSHIARLLSGSLRNVDVAARYGGEEFALILPSTSKGSAFRVAERARKSIASTAFSIPGGDRRGRLTISVGVATFPADAQDAADLIRKADSAMYAGKDHGKNCVRLYGQDRRSTRRVNVSLGGRFCVLAGEDHALTTTNVSEGGVRFLLDRKIGLGTLVDLVILVPGSVRGIQATGRVVRVVEKGEEKYEAALRLMDMTSPDRIRLSKYLGSLAGGDESDALSPGDESLTDAAALPE